MELRSPRLSAREKGFARLSAWGPSAVSSHWEFVDCAGGYIKQVNIKADVRGVEEPFQLYPDPGMTKQLKTKKQVAHDSSSSSSTSWARLVTVFKGCDAWRSSAAQARSEPSGGAAPPRVCSADSKGLQQRRLGCGETDLWEVWDGL